MSIGKNIKKIREENNLTQKEFAEISGVTDKAVSMWEQEKREPRMGALQKISDKFGVKISEIIGDGAAISIQSNTVTVPVLKQIPLNISVVSKKDICGYIKIDETNINKFQNYIFYEITDDRMSPVFLKNDKVLIHLKNYINTGSYGVISVNGEKPFIAKIMYYGERVELISENKNFETLCFQSSEFKKLKVLGEIKQLIRKF